MTLPRTWLPRAEEIQAVLRKMKSKQLDRSAIEELFQLQRRAAIDLMNQVGRTGDRATGFLVQRTALLTWVERVAKAESWQLQRRKETSEELSRSLAEIQAIRTAMAREGRQPVSFPVVEQLLQATCTSLPSSIRIEHGRITIAVEDGEPDDMSVQACQLLYELAMALNNDAAGFKSRIAADVDAHELTSLQTLVTEMQQE
jgi:hypothetical protein